MHFDLAVLGESALRLGLALMLGCAIGFEQIVGRLSLEPNVSAATWQIDRTIAAAET